MTICLAGSGRAMRLARFALFCGVFATGIPVGAIAQTWGPMTVLDNNPNGETLGGAVVDPFGNAWVTMIDIGDAGEVPWVVKVVESNGTTGTWQAPVTLASSYFILVGGQITVDSQGRITVIYSYLGGVPYQYFAVRYIPGSGWQPPVTLVTSQDYVLTVGVAMDSAGDVVLVYRQLIDSGNPYVVDLWSVTVSGATGMPGTPQRLTGPFYEPSYQAIAASPDGSHLMLAYAAEDGPAGGFSVKSYDAASQTWGNSVSVPWTGLAGFDVGGYLHLTVDNSGNATMLMDYVDQVTKAWTVYGYRYQNGGWQSAPVFSSSMMAGGFNSWGGMIVDTSGVVLGLMGYLNSDNSGTEYAFRYTPGVGWDTETVGPSVDPAYQSWGSTFAGGDVAIYWNNDDFVASLYQNGAWSALPPIPDNILPYYISTALAPNGTMLLAEGTAGYVVQATWLEP
jgi:hypothetical protein